MKPRHRTPAVTATALLVLALLAAACGLPLPQTDGNLTFPDFVAFRSILGGVSGEIDFEQVLVGSSEGRSLRLGNQGSRDLVIDSVVVVGDGFDFAERRPPELPMVIPAGGTRTVYLAFYPETNGRHTGTTAIVTGATTRYVELTGAGMWEVTLSVNSVDGRILAPALVDDPAEPKTVTTVDGTLALSAEAGFLRKFSTWTVVGAPKAAPEFADVLGAEAEVSVRAHTHIQAVFINPWVFFPSEAANLQTAIETVRDAPDKEGVIVTNGVHAIAYNVTLHPGVGLYGGYNGSATTATDREYKTAADRENELYRSVLTFGALNRMEITDGTGVTIEGVTMRREAAGLLPLLTVRNGAAPLIQYVTLSAAGAKPALEIRQASPQVKFSAISGGNAANESVALRIAGGAPLLQENLIRGGNTTADYSESYGVWGSDGTEAVLFANTIAGGTAGGTQGESFGIFLNWECRPLIVGNSIVGGSAPGTGGMSNGIYFINNGKATIRYNSIAGGTVTAGGMSRALYSAYGTNLYLRYNAISAGGGGGKYGIYLGANGRVRRLVHNGFTDVNTAHQYVLITGVRLTSVADLNAHYNTDTNVEGPIVIAVPEEPGMQEWDE